MKALNNPRSENFLLKLPEVINSTGKSRSVIYADIQEGTFPKPIRIGKRAVAWLAEDIALWIETQIQKCKGE
jgi:prophage regulatory protein